MTWIHKILMIALCTTILCGCDDDQNNSLVGTWSTSSISGTKTDGTAVKSLTAPTWTEQLVVNEDGTFSYTSTYSTSVLSGTGTWSAENAEILFSGSATPFTYDVDGDNMTLSGTVSAGSYVLTWSRQ